MRCKAMGKGCLDFTLIIMCIKYEEQQYLKIWILLAYNWGEPHTGR